MLDNIDFEKIHSGVNTGKGYIANLDNKILEAKRTLSKLLIEKAHMTKDELLADAATSLQKQFPFVYSSYDHFPIASFIIDVHTWFFSKEKPIYVTSFLTPYYAKINIVNATVELGNRIKIEDFPNGYTLIPENIGHPHVSRSTPGSVFYPAESCCFGNNRFLRHLKNGMTYNDISIFLTGMLRWFSEVNVDDSFGTYLTPVYNPPEEIQSPKTHITMLDDLANIVKSYGETGRVDGFESPNPVTLILTFKRLLADYAAYVIRNDTSFNLSRKDYLLQAIYHDMVVMDFTTKQQIFNLINPTIIGYSHYPDGQTIYSFSGKTALKLVDCYNNLKEIQNGTFNKPNTDD